MVTIQPLPKFGICSTGQCMLTTEHVTISGLELNTNYTISIMASACQTLSNILVTNVLIKQKQGITKLVVYKWHT